MLLKGDILLRNASLITTPLNRLIWIVTKMCLQEASTIDRLLPYHKSTPPTKRKFCQHLQMAANKSILCVWYACIHRQGVDILIVLTVDSKENIYDITAVSA